MVLQLGSSDKVSAAFAFQIAKIQFYSPVDTEFIQNETRLYGPRPNGARLCGTSSF